MLFFTTIDVVAPIDRHWPRCDVAASFFTTKCGNLNNVIREGAVMADLKQDYWQNYVDSNWVDGGAGRLALENPGTGEPLAEFALADADFLGSVLSLLKTKSEDEAINIANSTKYMLSAEPSPQISTPRTAPPALSAPARSSSMSGLPAGWRPPSVAMANQAMAAKRAAKRCGTTCRPKTSPIAQGRFKPRPDPHRRKAIALAAALPPSRRHGCGGREARLPQFRPYWDE